MSKKHKNRKHKQEKNQQKKKKFAQKSDKNLDNTSGRREPIEVIKSIKHCSNPIIVKSPTVNQTINNTYAGKSYKVVKQPEKWECKCPYVDQIGHCIGTDKTYGAKLKFSKGEMIYIPFESIELVDNDKKPNVEMNEHSEDNLPNQNAVVGLFYKIVRKPPGWKSNCRFLDRTGKCIKIDDRGVRIKFYDNDEVSFPIDCIKEVPSINLNTEKDSRKNEITQESVKHGDLFKVIKRPDKFGADADKLIGMIGSARWANYRSVCLHFSDGSGYTIDFESLEKYTPIRLGNPIEPNNKLTASTVLIGREYKLIKIPPDWKNSDHLLNQVGKVEWTSHTAKGSKLIFRINSEKIEKVVPFDCMSELPRPTEEELIEIIKKNPHRILNIIKSLRKITQLKPVIDFVDGACLPDVRPKSNDAECKGNAPKTIGESVDQMQDAVLSLIGPIKPTNSQNEEINLNSINPT